MRRNQLVIAVFTMIMLLTAGSATTLAVELRVTTPADLVSCASGGAPLAAGPDLGQTSVAGDTCVLSPGVYAVPAVVNVCLDNLTITSTDGSSVTSVTGAFGGALIPIQARGVRIEEISITNTAGSAIGVGTGLPCPAGITPTLPNEDIVIKDNFINGNAGAGVFVITPGPIEDFEFDGNTIRGNTAAGIIFLAAVTRVNNITIVENILDSNDPAGASAGIDFFNTGNVNNVSIQGNDIVRTGGHGIRLSPFVTNVQSFDVDNNLIRFNGAAAPAPGGNGVLFANVGQVDANIVGNRQGDAGINGNNCSGVFVDGAGSIGGGPFYGGAVTGVEMKIDGNFFSRNGLGPGCPGVTFSNSGNVDDFELTNNEIDGNSADGVLVINGSDFKDSVVSGNTMRNNGRAGFLGVVFGGNGFSALPTGDVESISFSDNVATQNFIHGSLIASLTNDVSDISFRNEQYSSNGLGGGGPGLIPAGIEVTSFGSVSNIQVTGSSMQSNGGPGIHIDANGTNLATLGLAPMNPSDLTDVLIDDNQLGFNGASSPIGAGDGVFMIGDKVSDIVASNNFASTNDDNGIHVAGLDDVSDIEIMGNELSNNDRNNDSVGAGVRVESNQDVDGVMVVNNTASNNDDGITIQAGGQNVGNVTIDGNSAVNNNNSNGIEVIAPDDLSSIAITNNTATGNTINLLLRANDRSSNINVSGNRFVGASGIGIQLDATNVNASNNDIRNHTTGIIATRAEGSSINNNNIARNDVAIDATGLGVGETLDASNNWWGEPSGPRAPSNPNGFGNEVTSKVNFTPFLNEPVGTTGANFQIFDFNVQSQIDVGQTLTITATVQNTGTEEGTQDIVIQIKDGGGNVVNEERRSQPLNPQAETSISITHTFSPAGNYSVVVTTGNDSATRSVQVGDDVPPPTGGGSIEASIAGSDCKISDTEILNAISMWILGQEVSGTSGQTINDEKILKLIQYWILGETVC